VLGNVLGEVLQFLRKPLTFEENLLAVIYLFSGYAVFAVNWKETRAFFSSNGIEGCQPDLIINDWSAKLQ